LAPARSLHAFYNFHGSQIRNCAESLAMQRKHHEERVLRIVAWIEIENERAIWPERAVPRAARFIDALVAVDVPGAGWGPLGPMLASRLVAIEHFSEPPGLAACVRSVSKLGHLVDEWWTGRDAGVREAGVREEVGEAGEPGDAGEPGGIGGTSGFVWPVDAARHGSRPPVLLILSNGQPRRALAGIGFEPGPVAGIWQVQRRALGDLVLVNLRGVPNGRPGCSVLRLMVESTDVREARAAIAALVEDPTVVQSTKDGILEEMMRETIPSTPAERGTILERARQEGMREILLSIARTRCGEEVIRELAEIEDVETIRRRVLALLGDG
jgi:hypothetical protein